MSASFTTPAHANQLTVFRAPPNRINFTAPSLFDHFDVTFWNFNDLQPTPNHLTSFRFDVPLLSRNPSPFDVSKTFKFTYFIPTFLLHRPSRSKH